MEQKKVTQGLVMVQSEEGGRYMASEKQVSNNLSISVLKREQSRPAWSSGPHHPGHDRSRLLDSPVQVVDVVERWRLCKPHPGLPDVFAAVYRLHALHRVLDRDRKWGLLKAARFLAIEPSAIHFLDDSGNEEATLQTT